MDKVAGKQGDREIDPRGQRELMLMLHRCCSGYVVACVQCVFVCMCVSTLRSHDRDSGSAVILGSTMQLAGADRSEGSMSNRAACRCFCVCSEVNARESPPKRHNH